MLVLKGAIVAGSLIGAKLLFDNLNKSNDRKFTEEFLDLVDPILVREKNWSRPSLKEELKQTILGFDSTTFPRGELGLKCRFEEIDGGKIKYTAEIEFQRPDGKVVVISSSKTIDRENAPSEARHEFLRSGQKTLVYELIKREC